MALFGAWSRNSIEKPPRRTRPRGPNDQSTRAEAVSPARRTWRCPCRRRCRAWRGPSWRRASASRAASVMRMRAPEAPIGWPMAMAPPLTLTLLVSQPRSLLTASACAAKASLASIRSRSLDLPAGLLQRLARGGDRARAHDLRIDAGGGPGGDAGERLQPALLGFLRASSAPRRRRRH